MTTNSTFAPESVGCPGDWSSDDGCCGRCAVSRTHHFKVTPHQCRMLAGAMSRGGRLSAGRYGWNTSHVRVMARRGWVRLVKEFTWDSTWVVTPEGERVAEFCGRQP